MALRSFARILFCTIFGFFLCLPAMAQDDDGVSGETEKSAEEDLVDAQTDALQDQVANLMTSLEIDEAQHFAVLYSNYTIYSMVDAVRTDVENASNACAENNKDMATAVLDRFARWDGNVSSTMKDAYANIEAMALAQTYMPQSEVKTFFGLISATRQENSSRFETVPVTTPEACEFMMSKMDETEDSMIHMLRATMISFPTVLQKNQK